jgi:hypothetical protein
VRDGDYARVALGSLEDEPSIRPTELIFVASNAHWFEIRLKARAASAEC